MTRNCLMIVKCSLISINILSILMLMIITRKDPFGRRLMKKGTIYQVENFQKVSNGTDLLVYTAYLDERLRLIRVIGVTSVMPASLFCLLRYQYKPPISVRAQVKKIWDNFERRYTAMFILCPIHNMEFPNALSISTDRNLSESVSNKLPIKKIPLNQTKRNFTVCISPIHSRFSDIRRVIEWLEMNIILGVDLVFVYVHSCPPELLKILEVYQLKENVAIINWTVPDFLCEPVKLTDILLKYCGQIAALNDCLYRNKGYSRYIAVLDFDEYIIPQTPEDITWMDMMQRLPESEAYVFRNVFFVGLNADDNRLITQSDSIRQNYTYATHQRSKYIAKTDSVVTAGVHFPFVMTGKEHMVNPQIGLMHHYRQQTVILHSNKFVESSIMKKYASKLQRRISQL